MMFQSLKIKRKRDRLFEIVNSAILVDGRVVIFVQDRKMADFLASLLCERNISATSIHGLRYPYQRESAFAEFRSGHRQVLVSTSVNMSAPGWR